MRYALTVSRRDLGREASRRGTAVICRIGKHRWSADQNVGAGIVRRVCSVCRSVTIDLTKSAETAESSSDR